MPRTSAAGAGEGSERLPDAAGFLEFPEFSAINAFAFGCAVFTEYSKLLIVLVMPVGTLLIVDCFVCPFVQAKSVKLSDEIRIVRFIKIAGNDHALLKILLGKHQSKLNLNL